MLFGNGILVGKSNHLSNPKRKLFATFPGEFHGSQRISTVAIGDELEAFRQFLKLLESHTHGKNAGTRSPVVGHLVTDNGTVGSIHDKPDIGFDAADVDISFVGNEGSSFLVQILVHKGFDTDGGGFAVIGDLLMGDADVVQIPESLTGFTEGQTEVDVQCQAQRHNLGLCLRNFREEA